MTPEPAAILHALAREYRTDSLVTTTAIGVALAELFDGIGYHAPPRITELALAVAAAAGVTT